MARRASLPLILLAALAAVVAGCGADKGRGEAEGTTTPAASAPSVQPANVNGGPAVPAEATDPQRRAYIARVDSICKRLDPERNKDIERAGESADPQEAALHYDDTIAAGEKQLRMIKAVPAPPRDRKALQANVFDVLDAQLAIRRQIRTALAASDLAQVQLLRARLDNLTRSLVGFARGYGFQVCGED